MDSNNRYFLRNTASGLGFYFMAAFLSMVFASYLLAIISINGSADYTNPSLQFLISILASVLGLFVPGLIYCSSSRTRIQSVVPIKAVKPYFALRLVLIALAVSFVSNFMVDLLLTNLAQLGFKNNIEQTFETHLPLDNFLYFLSVAIMPPLVEEFMFRGIILQKLRRFGDAPAVFVSSLLFSLMHGNIVQIPFTFVAGIAFGFITVKCESLIPAMITHFCVNASSVIVTIFYYAFPDSESFVSMFYYLFIIVVVVGGLVSAASLTRAKGFFRLKSNALFPFGETLKASLTSPGMITGISFTIAETVLTMVLL